MSDTPWDLSDVDAETREQAIAEAERLGVDLADYLADVLLRRVSFDHPEAQADTQSPVVIDPRLEDLERRVDYSIDVLDRSMSGLAGRIDRVEMLAADAADAGHDARLETESNLAGVYQRLAIAERHTEAQEADAEALDERLALIEGAAQSAAIAHEALKHALAEDFIVFTRDIGEQLGAELDEVRAAAERAGLQADAAAAHVMAELRSARETLEARLQESAAETRQRMHAAFADTAERMNALSERVTENEHEMARTAEIWRAQQDEIDDSARVAIGESVRRDLSAEIAEMRERLADTLARLDLVDGAATAAGAETASLRETLEARLTRGETAVRDVLAQAQQEWDGRFELLAARLGAAEHAAADAHLALRTETERVETRLFAALEQRARGDSDAAVQRELTSVREQNAGVQARLRQLEVAAAPLSARMSRVESALGTQSGEAATRFGRLENEMASRALDRSFDERLLRLEAAAQSEETEHGLAALRGQIGALAARIDAQQAELPQRFDDLAARLGANEGDTPSHERLQKVEQSLMGLRLEAMSAAAASHAQAIKTIDASIAALEQRQADAFETLRAGIAQFLNDNDRRLDALEAASAKAAASDVAGEFTALRQRIEDRILEAERRSVRALEQAADTMAALEKHFVDGDDQAARSA